MDHFKRELEQIKRSAQYQIAELIVSVARSPFKNIWLFPFRMLRLLWKFKARGAAEPSIDEVAAGVLVRNFDKKYINKSKYLIQNREIHTCEQIKASEPFKDRSIGGMRVASLLDSEFYANFSFEADLRALGEGDWSECFSVFKPEFVLMNSAWKLSNSEDGLRYLEPGHWILSCLDFCCENKIPIVFWYTDDVANVNAFRAVIEKADYLFSVDDQSDGPLRSEFPDTIRTILPPAVQPCIHNAVLLDVGNRGKLSYLYDGWADFIDNSDALSEMLSPLKNEGLHVFDSRFTMVANKLNDIPTWRGNILGCLDNKQLVSAFKCYAVSLYPGLTLASSVSRSQRILEALACGGAVVASECSLASLPQDVIDNSERLLSIRPDDKTFVQEARRLLALSDAARASHKLRRYLMLNHSYSHRFSEIVCAVTGADRDPLSLPKVTLVTPTKRPELLLDNLKNYDGQNYCNKEWVIVVNKTGVGAQKIRDKLQERPDITVEFLHQEKNIGTCLNAGIALSAGELWFKMDDDDFYGENYLLDMVLAWRITGADMFGKIPAYIYSEANDTLYCRNSVSYSNSIVRSETPNMCGATLAGTVEVGRKYPFSETKRANVDSDFFLRALAGGCLLQFVDPYSFSVYRSSDDKFHTWRVDGAAVFENATKVSDGRGDEIVNF